MAPETCFFRTSRPEDAAHVLWVLTSFDRLDLLATGRDLPAEEVVRLLAQTAERSLPAPAAGTL